MRPVRQAAVRRPGLRPAGQAGAGHGGRSLRWVEAQVFRVQNVWCAPVHSYPPCQLGARLFPLGARLRLHLHALLCSPGSPCRAASGTAAARLRPFHTVSQVTCRSPLVDPTALPRFFPCPACPCPAGDCFDADLSIAGPTFQNLTGAAGPAAQVQTASSCPL